MSDQKDLGALRLRADEASARSERALMVLLSLCIYVVLAVSNEGSAEDLKRTIQARFERAEKRDSYTQQDLKSKQRQLEAARSELSQAVAKLNANEHMADAAEGLREGLGKGDDPKRMLESMGSAGKNAHRALVRLAQPMSFAQTWTWLRAI